MSGISNHGFRWVTAPREMMSIRRAGKLHRGRYLFIWVMEGPAVEELQVVAVVTAKGFPSATRRNLARRRASGGIMDARGLLEPGHSYLVEGRPGAEKVDYQFLVEDIERALTRTVD